MSFEIQWWYHRNLLRDLWLCCTNIQMKSWLTSWRNLQSIQEKSYGQKNEYLRPTDLAVSLLIMERGKLEKDFSAESKKTVKYKFQYRAKIFQSPTFLFVCHKSPNFDIVCECGLMGYLEKKASSTFIFFKRILKIKENYFFWKSSLVITNFLNVLLQYLGNVYVMWHEKETALKCREAYSKIVKLAVANLWRTKKDSKKSNSKISSILLALGKFNK